MNCLRSPKNSQTISKLEETKQNYNLVIFRCQASQRENSGCLTTFSPEVWDSENDRGSKILTPDTGSGNKTPEIWTLNSFLNYFWISPPVIHKFQNSSFVVASFLLPGLFWPVIVFVAYIFGAQVMLVSPCFETFLPFSSVTLRSPLWGIVMLGVLPSCESCSDHLVCPRPHTDSSQQ